MKRSFEELGREVDGALVARDRAAAFLEGVGDTITTRLGVNVDGLGADEPTGAVFLSAVLTEMIREAAPGMIAEAMKRLEAQADTARERFAAALGGMEADAAKEGTARARSRQAGA